MTLLEIVNNEAAIWKQAYQYDEDLIEGWTAFWEPEYGNHPHWNILYPRTNPSAFLSQQQKDKALSFYRNVGRTAHVLDFSKSNFDSAVSHDEYFYLDKSAREFEQSHPHLEIEQTDDLRVFSNILQQAFSLPDDFVAYFNSKMERLRKRVPSAFYLAKHEGEHCGCWSVFRTDSNVDFMMNFGLRDEFKGKKLSQQLMNAVVEKSVQIVCTHTNNPILAQKLLPGAGFTSAGQVHVVELCTYRRASNLK